MTGNGPNQLGVLDMALTLENIVTALQRIIWWLRAGVAVLILILACMVIRIITG
jgi:hypothetical protein